MTLAIWTLFALGLASARAGSVFGVDVGDYILLYEGNDGRKLSINNFGGIWTGNIGIAGTGKLAASGPGTLNGNIDFAAANTGQSSISNTTINGTKNFGVTGVQTTMNALNALSSILGGQAGASLAINTDSDQTVSASSGNLVRGNLLFNVTSVSSKNGENLIIKGNGSTGVVFNVNTPGDAQFHGNILLQDLNGRFFGESGYAGLFPDQVLFNLYGGSALYGGDKLDANNNGNDAHPANIIYGTFLDPNGKISFVNTRIVGRIFGGDSSDMQIVSGDTLTLPPPPPTPEPSSIVLALCGGFPFLFSVVRARRRSTPP